MLLQQKALTGNKKPHRGRTGGVLACAIGNAGQRGSNKPLR
jgi:hypothetical protein